MFYPLLHRPADLRLGAVDRHHAGGRARAVHAADRACTRQIAPPTVQVDCQYPGASAQVVAETVAAPIEQQVNGVEDMMYMSSQCTNDGSYTPDRDVQARHRPEHGPGAGAEPRRAGDARCCPT